MTCRPPAAMPGVFVSFLMRSQERVIALPGLDPGIRRVAPAVKGDSYSCGLLDSPLARAMTCLSDLLSRLPRRKPRVHLLRRHVGWNPRGVPGPARRGVLGPDPNLLAQFHVAEIHILIGQNDDHPLFDVDDDLLSRLDSRARPLF